MVKIYKKYFLIFFIWYIMKLKKLTDKKRTGSM